MAISGAPTTGIAKPTWACSRHGGWSDQNNLFNQIDIDKFAILTVSDTTGSARNVCDHFSAKKQVDCLMHTLSLCIFYALGLKENTRGGGLRVLQKLRDFAACFGKPSRLVKLMQIADMSNLPAVNIEVDAKTRVGYAVIRMRQSVYIHYAFTQYFEYASPSERDVWTDTSEDDWNIITEMEGLTSQFARFSLGGVQQRRRFQLVCIVFSQMAVSRD
ncbi:hypothetical protein JG687_00001707 [Phytophthora cactorum]|uniref:MULE transposase domain-containing protein n=1 Tax=Phytophthora cactorum TaxID=29920 RepID=A0A8T1UZ17_9STRA|nr:hypothetical protein GQ600_6837 [Phytophthora cactorum]KAG6972021.1 hypothetical protein JG687_00001707 [Phytophthora cactorum]